MAQYTKQTTPEDKGTLVITKTVDGDNITESEFEGALKFTVQNADGKYLDADGNLSDKKVELTLKDGGFVKGADGKYTKTFENVATGKYTVTETNSDVEGYALVADKSTTNGEATVENGGKATIDLRDEYQKLYSIDILRTDPETGEPVPGAVITLIDAETGRIISRWTSTGRPVTVGGLYPGRTCTIHEESAPDGYAKAPDYTLVLTETGAIDTNRPTVSRDRNGTILVIKPDRGSSGEGDTKPGTDSGSGQEGTKPSPAPGGDSTRPAQGGSEGGSSTTRKPASTASSGTRRTTSNTTSGSGSGRTAAGAQTGDDTDVAVPALSALAALAAILALLRKKRQQNMQ